MYRLTRKDIVILLLKSAVVAVITSWLFYNSLWGIIPGLVTGTLTFLTSKKSLQIKKKEEILNQFSDFLSVVAISIEAGFSIENSVRNSMKELKDMYKNQKEINGFDIERIVRKLELNIAIDEAFMEVAIESGIEEIKDFAMILAVIKKSGGNSAEIIKETIDRISNNIETEREIQTSLSGRKLEANIMSLMVPGMILYLRMTNTDYLTPVYGNVTGIIVMTICLGITIGAVISSKKIVDIRV